ncbi:hypothetical protein FACS189432_04990 [Bacteroidia bacterium]|nr:hypothetical protein FACS189432_04990 [Bacteroidia bacterium]
MKILIDTNILIQLEDNRIINEQFADFYKLAISNSCKILYHPEAIPSDISRDTNHDRKEIIKSKLQKYETLENFAKLADEFNEQLGANRINDKIDNVQLFQIYKGYVDYFLTEDKGIHTKAKRINLEDKVLDISKMLSLLEEQFTIKIPQHPILREHSIREYDNASKYAIPIQPQYYSTLFKDGKFRERTLFDGLDDSIREIQGNTIVKAYISNSKNKKLKEGDLLLFYASQNNKSIEPIGILETCQIVDNFDELWGIVCRKTVFSKEKLSEMLQEKKKLHVITFRLIAYLTNPIGLDKITTLKSLKNKIQTITKISEEDYQILKDEKYFDRRYIVD